MNCPTCTLPIHPNTRGPHCAACKASARSYRRIGLAWNDPDARRTYDRDQQRKWRAANYVPKRPAPQAGAKEGG
jgi:hypothetical protein